MLHALVIIKLHEKIPHIIPIVLIKAYESLCHLLNRLLHMCHDYSTTTIISPSPTALSTEYIGDQGRRVDTPTKLDRCSTAKYVRNAEGREPVPPSLNNHIDSHVSSLLNQD